MKGCGLCRAALLSFVMATPVAMAQAARAPARPADVATKAAPGGLGQPTPEEGKAASPDGGPAPAQVDYTRDQPPETRSWQRRSPLDDVDSADLSGPGTAAAEAAITSQEYQLVRPLLRMVMVLAAIVLLMLLLARGARFMQLRLPGWVGGQQATPQGPRLHIVDRLALGPKHSLAWVERDDGGAFLVAWGEGGTSLLGPLARGSRPSFAATMAEVTHEPTPSPSPHTAASPVAPGH